MENGPGHIQRTKWAFPVGNDPCNMKRKPLWRLLRLRLGVQLQSGNEKKGVKTLKPLGFEKSEGKREWVSFRNQPVVQGRGKPKLSFPYSKHKLWICQSSRLWWENGNWRVWWLPGAAVGLPWLAPSCFGKPAGGARVPESVNFLSTWLLLWGVSQ